MQPNSAFNFHKIIFIVFLFLFLSACKSIQTAPEAPEAEILPATFQMPPLSVIGFTIEADLKSIEDNINTTYKDTLFFDNDFENNNRDNLQIAVIKEAPIKISAINDQIIIQAPLRIWVNGRFKEQIFAVKGLTDGLQVEKQQDASFRIVVKSLSKVTINSDWTVTSQTISNFQWKEAPYIALAGLKIPIGSFVEKTINNQIKIFAKQLDKSIAQDLALKTNASTYWETIQNPVLVNETYNTYLSMQPERVVASPLQAKGKSIGMKLGFYTHLFLKLEKPESPKKPKPLPFLEIAQEIPDSIQLLLNSQMTYEALSTLSKKQFVGQTFSSDDNKSKITVNDVTLYGSGKFLVTKLQINGFAKQGLIKKKINGFIYLQGIPVYNEKNQLIELTQFDFTVKSSDILLKTAAWLLKSNMKKQLLPYLSYSVKESMAESIQEANAMLNREWHPNLHTKGKISRVEPGKIHLDKQGINMAIQVTAHLTVNIK